MSRRPDKIKRADWEARIERWDAQRDDVSVTDFCASEGVTESSFFWWQRKIRRAAKARRVAPVAPVAPVPVAPVAPVPVAPVAVGMVTCRWPSGVCIQVPADQPDTLARLIEVLGTAGGA